MTAMKTLERQRILITGGSRGLGLGVVEALVARHANVTVIARDTARLADLKARLGVSVIAGDATDPTLADSVLRERAAVGAGAERRRDAGDDSLAQQTWESFNKNWNTDVKATFHWIQAALNVCRLRPEVGFCFHRAAPRSKAHLFPVVTLAQNE